jgi:hypothetical protein
MIDQNSILSYQNLDFQQMVFNFKSGWKVSFNLIPGNFG